MTELAKALAAFHADLPEVGKGSINPAFHSRYADLADIVKVVLPALAAQGLAWTALPTVTETGFVLEYRLMHVSGEQLEGSWPLPDPSKVNAQALGSAVTYAKRYALSAVTGIAPDADDDGNAASAGKATARAPRAAQPKTPAPDRIANAATAIRDAKDRTELDGVWERVQKSGLAGIPELIAAHKTAGEKFPAETTDTWAVTPIPE